jgi:predicted unusual protein kinase regulating ubiquinone biosynthesis (AarF/ABC1/UbiB family)
MEFVDGIKITDVAALRRAGIEPDRVARTLAEAYAEQVLVHGFFHADPHPGNLLVQRRPSGEPRLVFLDFGLAKELPPRFREGVARFTGALLRGDAAEMAGALLEMGFQTRDGSPRSLAEIARFLLEVATSLRERSHLDPETVERVRREVPERIRRNPIVRIPSHVVLLGRVLGLLSGVSRSLETRLDLVRILLPFVLRPRA